MFENKIETIPVDALFARADLPECQNLFYSKKWIAVLKTGYGLDFVAVVNARTGHYLLFSVHDDLAGKKLQSLPFSDYVMPALAPEDAEGLLHHALVHHPDAAVIFKATASLFSYFEAQQWRVMREALYHRVAIADEDTMWKRLAPSFQRGLHKAKKNDVQVSLRYDREAVDRFYGLHAKLRQKKFHSLAQPRSFFHAVHQEYLEGQEGFVLEATRNEVLLASMIVLQHEQILYYKFGASEMEALDFRPNNLLFWHLLSWAREHGYQQVDLGLSGTSEAYQGLVRFKEAMGGVAHPIKYFRKDPPGFDHLREASFKKLLSELTGLFAGEGVELKTAQQAGEILYRYFF